eukprot:scaffold3166_cov399-Prasinococcus_capsulatus_cf.AAC.12
MGDAPRLSCATTTSVQAVLTASLLPSVAPHGGELVDLMVDAAEKDRILGLCEGREIEISDRNACDLELLMVGGFSPLKGFMGEAEYKSVVDDMKLPSGLLFGIPVVLDIPASEVDHNIISGKYVALKYQGKFMGAMEVSEIYSPNKPLEALNCYGTSSLEHPGVQMIAMERGPLYVGGKVVGFELPERVFPCATPKEVRDMLPMGKDVVAFQCRNPVHRAHYELFTRAAKADNVGDGAVVLVHPTCGPTQADDIPGVVRYRTYEVLKEEMNDPSVFWAYLPYSMHMAGPR